MAEHFYIGIDGGATKSIIRIEDEKGHLLGRLISGPANIRLSVEEAWQSINEGLQTLLQSLSLSLYSENYFHVGMGLAGCEVLASYQAFIQSPHPFSTLVVTSDSHAACLGAHNGKDGAIIIAGTGVVGFQIENGKSTQVSGWGFPHDDEGGGAWLGLQAVKMTLQWLDKRLPSSKLATAIFDYFNQDLAEIVKWANAANSTKFASLAPLIIEQAGLQDEGALALLKQAASALDQVGIALFAAQTEKQTPLPCALVGSITSFLTPYLSKTLMSRVVKAHKEPDEGAILFLRDYLAKRGCV